MAYGMTIEDFPVLCDRDGKLQAWVDQHAPLDALPIAGPPAWKHGNLAHEPYSIPLNELPWSFKPPRWLINSLWIPTGASRWSIGLFLLRAREAQDLKALGVRRYLVEIDDGRNRLGLYLARLAEIPLGHAASDMTPVLWVMHDWRYTAQMAGISQSGIANRAILDWPDVFNAIQQAIRVRTDALNLADAPDAHAFLYGSARAALLADLAVITLGGRIVPDIHQGEMTLFALPHRGQIPSDATRVSGGKSATPNLFPRTLFVHFPWDSEAGLPVPSGRYYRLAAERQEGFGNATIRSTMLAIPPIDPQGQEEVPYNVERLQDVADQLLESAFVHHTYAFTYPGLDIPSAGEGLRLFPDDDYLWIQFGARGPGGKLLCQTIRKSLPANWYCPVHLGQLYNTTQRRTSGLLRVELTSEFTEQNSETTASAMLLDANRETKALTPDIFAVVTVRDTLGLTKNRTLKSGDRVWVTLPHDSDWFELVSTGLSSFSLPMAAFRITNRPSPSVYEAQLEYSFRPAQEENQEPLPGVTATGMMVVHDPLGLWNRAVAGCRGLAAYNHQHNAWEIIVCQQVGWLATATLNVSGNMGLNGDIDYVPVRNFRILSPPPFDFAPNPAVNEVFNQFGHMAPPDAELLVIWDASSEEWIIIDVPKRRADILTNLRIFNNKLQGHRVKVAVESDVENMTADAHWTDLIELTTCEPPS